MAMQLFSGRDYLKIDIANSFGLDKQDWDERLAWFDQNEHQLEALMPQADEPALYYAGLVAWEKCKAGKVSGYPISLDATASGIQILAALSCDPKAAAICNVIDVGHRKDAYVQIYHEMVSKLGEEAKIDRKQSKQALMTHFYCSTAVPKRVFGEGELLSLFYDTIIENAPGPEEINKTMLSIWDPTKLTNEWVMPDNFHVIVKVMGQVKETVHFLNEPFEVDYHINMPIKEGRSLGANMVHSIDGMMVREMLRRCNYDPARIQYLHKLIDAGAAGRSTHKADDKMVQILWDRYLQSGFLSARILDHLTIDNIGLVNGFVIKRLLSSLPEKPFQVMSVHDCFRCLPNYGNDLRRQYNELLALIAESNMLADIVGQLLGKTIQVNKIDPSLGNRIRESNYALS
ncbi:DNA-directed RNA polymerase [Mesorhizobium yinganensis]|uniref:DNA-directed RNA polymerase n=1 Tax=Mesorhizobium yinganensis TaxID=3157707 RepID=UPI0032B83161